MARNPHEAALALHRFGFGPRAGSIEAIAGDPRGALIAELDRPRTGQISNPDLPTSGAANRAVFEYNAERNANQKRKPRDAAQAQVEAAPAQPEVMPLPRQLFRNEARTRIDAALNAEIGFVERLVWFWSNHFCVNAISTVMAGAYEREVIRPHVLGRFADLLLAAESHPAMLVYLNNASSMGPNSVAGINRNRGLNENLGREILELHTLGVRTGYTQDDVVSFAKVITGWTTYLPNLPEHGGEFVFFPRFHEPGPQTVLGKAYRDTGFEQGKAVLADLARHPATALHVATKLARHFVADEPPATLVETLRQKFVETDGDLWQVARALVMAPESWAPEQTKLKRPSEWMMTSIRAAGFNGTDVRLTAPALTRLGEPLWRPPSPKGFPDEEGAWIDGIAHRLDTANAIARNPANLEGLDPKALLEIALGPLASADTRSAVNRAETKQQAVTLLLMAPEVQRR